ncbi:MAG: tetraacyldisaccharide 4'-kinase [Acidobacteria bacterium]|jgi:tetraacyldisaccharide 4'-kinase|nr:MAG: tetraacyldisaccharide 4'-kinase [Acidobacteriota bacterium]
MASPYELINPYFWAVSLRNRLYDKGVIQTCRPHVPVISVGNLSVGGSGKSSLVRFIAQNLLTELKPCILSRGYKRRTRGTLLVSERGELYASWEEAGDEPYMLAKLLKEASVVVDEDRCRGALFCLERLKPDLIILDDGFQHRRIERDIDIVLLKAKDLRDRLLPFGRLREPLSSLERADIIVLSYAEQENTDWKHLTKPTFRMFRKNWRFVNTLTGQVLENLEGSFIAFSGLGDNRQFFHTLKNLGVTLKETIGFPDHYHYRGFRLRDGELYITTLKDAVKLPPVENLYYLDFEVELEGLIEYLSKFIINRLKGR